MPTSPKPTPWRVMDIIGPKMTDALYERLLRLKAGDVEEVERLKDLVFEFSQEMLKKLLEQFFCFDRRGWSNDEDPECWGINVIKSRIREHIKKGDPIDVANFAAFWWWLDRQARREAEALGILSVREAKKRAGL